MKSRVQNLFLALTLLAALNLQPATAFAQGTAFSTRNEEMQAQLAA